MDATSEDAPRQLPQWQIIFATQFQLHLAKAVKADLHESLQKIKAGFGGEDRAVFYVVRKFRRLSQADWLSKSASEAIKERKVDGTPSRSLRIVSTDPALRRLAVALHQECFDFFKRAEFHTQHSRQDFVAQEVKRLIFAFTGHVLARQTLAVARMPVVRCAFDKKSMREARSAAECLNALRKGKSTAEMTNFTMQGIRVVVKSS